MKKFIVFCMLCIFLFVASLYKPEFDFSKVSNLNVQVYTNDCQNGQLNKYSTIKNGGGLIVFCDYDGYKNIKSMGTKINGVTFVFDGNLEFFNQIIGDLKVNFTEKTKTDFVGYTNFFDNCIEYKHKKVNIQGYFNGEKIYIGTPLILGSY